MLNKYLNSNPIPWLIEDSNPSVKYLAKKFILGNADSNDYAALEKYYPVKKILEKLKNGIFGNLNQFDAYYTGSMWLFAQAVYLGLDSRHEVIKKTAEAIIGISQLSSGGFSTSAQPKTVDACLTGLMAGYLIISSVENKSADAAIQWIKNNQRYDGGWLHTPYISNIDILKKIMFNKAGKGLIYESNEKIPSCVYATSACMNAIILDNNDNKHSLHIKKAADFFLKNRLFVNGQTNSTPSKIRKNLNSNFSLISVPFFCQYDILEGLNLIALSGNFTDIKISEAFNMIINKQNNDSRWNLESLSPGMLNMPEEKINHPSKFVTLRMINLLNNIKSDNRNGLL
jgi:hypothetical protein